MNFFLRRSVFLKFLLAVIIDVRDRDWIEIACLPERLRSLCFKDLIIYLHLFFMVLQVAISDHVVVSLEGRSDRFPSIFLVKAK